MTDILENLPAIAVPVALAIVASVAIGAMLAYRKLGDDRRRHVALVVAGVATAELVVCGCLAADAVRHGLYTPNVTVGHVISAQDATPKDESDLVPDDLSTLAGTSTMVELYRWGCPDCEATHAALETWAAENGVTIIHVSSRSDEGRTLATSLGITEVPALIAVSPEGDVVWRVIYATDEDGETTLVQERLDKLLTTERG